MYLELNKELETRVVSDPNLTLLPVQTRSQSLIFKKIISQQPQEVPMPMACSFLHKIIYRQCH